jgi:hypothetical protein
MAADYLHNHSQFSDLIRIVSQFRANPRGDNDLDRSIMISPQRAVPQNPEHEERDIDHQFG